MILLDENFPQDQCPLLRRWGIRYWQIGREIGKPGTDDSALIPLLHSSRRVTFFTQDEDFFDSSLPHRTYCLVWLDVRADDCALCVRRFLRHPRFNTEAKRLGAVARVHHDGIDFWQHQNAVLHRVRWEENG